MRKLLSSAVALGTSLLLASAAHAATISFEDLSGQFASLPSSYEGLKWSNFGYQIATSSPGGYHAAITSGSHVAFNEFAKPASISGDPFDLLSANFTAAWNDSLQLEITAFHDGAETYDHTFTLNALKSTTLTLNLVGIDSVTFRSFGGTPHPSFSKFGSGAHFAVDDLSINTYDFTHNIDPTRAATPFVVAVPLPPASLMALPLLALLPLLTVRFRKSAVS